jgi:hypothetical protein
MQMRSNDSRECLFPALEELQSCGNPIGVHPTSKQALEYPPDLDTSMKGVDAEAKKLRFLQEIPRSDAGHDRLQKAPGDKIIRIPTPGMKTTCFIYFGSIQAPKGQFSAGIVGAFSG